MKISMKILAASVALATMGMSGAANATIQLGTGSVSGELFLTAFDAVGLQSYSRDLGVLQSDFLANTSQHLTYNLNKLDTGAADTNWATFIGTGNKGVGVIYTVTSYNGSYTAHTTGAAYGSAYGFLTTSPSVKADIELAASSQQKLSNTGGTMNDFAQDSNAAAGQTTLDAASVAQNNSSLSVPGDTGYFDKPTWSINDGGKSFLTIGDIDNSVAFYSALLNTTNFIDGVVTKLPNVWKLTKAGDLTYAPSAVPVPAALWLFGSGLLGLVSIARRRKV